MSNFRVRHKITLEALKKNDKKIMRSRRQNNFLENCDVETSLLISKQMRFEEVAASP